MENDLFSQCEREILKRLADAGPKGLNKRGLCLPYKKFKWGKVCEDVLKRLLKDGEVGDLGSRTNHCYVTREQFKPLEIAYEHIEVRARDRGVRLCSKKTFNKERLRGAAKKKFEEALKLLVAEGVLIRLKWSSYALYLHVSALPQMASVKTSRESKMPDIDALRRAYIKTSEEVGHEAVLIYELYKRVGGELKPFLEALMKACRSHEAVPYEGDWSMTSPEARTAALEIRGQPHLRIRFES